MSVCVHFQKFFIKNMLESALLEDKCWTGYHLVSLFVVYCDNIRRISKEVGIYVPNILTLNYRAAKL